MKQGIEKDRLEKDISKLDFQSVELNKVLNEIFDLKQQIDSNYTNPINQEETNNSLQAKIEKLNNNRNQEIELFKYKIIQYKKITNETEKIFSQVKTNIKVE